MELRRALLLFAIVLGLAAIASSLSRDTDSGDPTTPAAPEARSEERPTREPSASPRIPAGDTDAIAFAGSGKPVTRTLKAGLPGTLTVAVEKPGQVEIPGLGLSAPAEPLTPARFEVLADEPGRYPVLLRPADGDEPTPLGTLLVTGVG